MKPSGGLTIKLLGGFFVPYHLFILHTDYIFSISPDCRAPAKCINECKTVNPGGLQYNPDRNLPGMIWQTVSAAGNFFFRW